MPTAPHHKNWPDIDVSPMVPEEFVQFRPLVADALVFFLERLSVPRLAELVNRQHDLPADASAEERLADLISQCPTLHKLGQVVARDRRLSAELRQHLQTLETMEPTTPLSVVTQAIERVFGTRVTDTEHLSNGARKELASLVLKELVAKPIWNTEPRAIFHADPHAGNLFYTQDGRLAILDWSLVGYLGKCEREQTAQIVLGALNLDANRILRAISAMAIELPNEPALREVVAKAVAALYRTEAPGLHWLLNLLGDAMFKAGVLFGEDLVLFRKSVLTLEGVAADVSKDLSLGKVLPLSGALVLLRDWARRCVASPISRDFGTKIWNTRKACRQTLEDRRNIPD